MGKRYNDCWRPDSGNGRLLCALCDKKNNGPIGLVSLFQDGPMYGGIFNSDSGVHPLFNTTRYRRLLAPPVWVGGIPFGRGNS